MAISAGPRSRLMRWQSWIIRVTRLQWSVHSNESSKNWTIYISAASWSASRAEDWILQEKIYLAVNTNFQGCWYKDFKKTLSSRTKRNTYLNWRYENWFMISLTSLQKGDLGIRSRVVRCRDFISLNAFVPLLKRYFLRETSKLDFWLASLGRVTDDEDRFCSLDITWPWRWGTLDF